MSPRRMQGDETRYRLLNWTSGQAASERLAGHILAADGFESVDPSHPLGGPDRLRDLVCNRNTVKWVGACYFANGQRSFAQIRSKFASDAQGAIAYGAAGFVFVTNQRLSIGERDRLLEQTTVPQVEIYHLERIVHVLDRPESYGIRQDYLGIDMTTEELLAFFASVSHSINEWQAFRQGEWREEVTRLILQALAREQSTP